MFALFPQHITISKASEIHNISISSSSPSSSKAQLLRLGLIAALASDKWFAKCVAAFRLIAVREKLVL
jgi:hypothetical protein